MRKRAVLLVAATVISGAVVTGSPIASASLPAGTSQVSVTSGNSVLGIDGHVQYGGGVSGHVVRAAGGAGVQAGVEVWSGGKLVAIGQSDPTGDYTIEGLLDDNNYAVCVPSVAIVTSTQTGLRGRCHGGAAYDGKTPPGAAYTLPVASGELVTSIDIVLPKAAAISGKVTTPGGAGLAGVTVLVRNRSTGRTFHGATTGSGTYLVNGLTPSSSGYTVCFHPHTLGTGTGFLPRCYLNAAWSGFGSPSGAQAVSASTGQVHQGIDQRLPHAGAISGTVRKGSGAALPHVAVVVFSAAGRRLASTTTDIVGHYTVRGLSAATGDRVCVAPFDASDTVRYLGRCWRTTSWTGRGLPAGTDPVAVQVGATHTGINLTVGRTVYVLGTIAGTVHQTLTPGPMQAADVYLFSNSGTQLRQTNSDVDGNYSFPNLRPSAAGYVVCVSAALTEPSPFSATGWESRCHSNTLWDGISFPVPTAATRVALAPGQQVTGVDVTLHPGGGIEGYVYVGDTDTTPLTATIPVYAFTPGGRQVVYTLTNPETGGYELEGLNPGNYVVCFDPRPAGGTPAYQAQCYNSVGWMGPL
jgi:hypothetical protein